MNAEFNLSDSSAIKRYKKISIDMIRKIHPEMTIESLNRAIDYSIAKRFKNFDIKIYNSYLNQQVDSDAITVVDYFEDRKPIITAAGVMWYPHSEADNPFSKLLQKFIDNRTKAKKEMFKYPVGSEMFQKYNLTQLLAKIDANALYGALGQPNCLFYNLHVAESTTTQGRSYTSASLLFFESFLANNVKFGSLNEVITFIHNVINEKEERKYKDSSVLDENITVEECWYKIMKTAGFYWIPNDNDMQIVMDILEGLDQEDINRLYYKNNLYNFFMNSSMRKSLVELLKMLKKPFLNPNKPPEEIKVELDAVLDLVKEYVYYGHQYIDRIDRVEVMPRKIDIVTDTDSNIISLDAWYRFVLDIIDGEDIHIANWLYDAVEFSKCDEFGDYEKIKPVKYYEKVLDYDFMKDEVIEKDRLMNPMYVIPQDALRHSIINIMGYIGSALIVDYMERYTKNSYSYDPETHKCMIIMKNEFLFKRLLATDGKKNYADIRELQEGNPVSKSKSLAIMGLPIDKNTLPEKTKKSLQKILKEDVLDIEQIDPLVVLKKLILFEKEIISLLKKGDKSYYKPLTVKAMYNYPNPMSIQGIKASIAYNALRDPGHEALDLDARNSIDIIKTNITRDNIKPLEQTNPKKYSQIIDLMNSYIEFDSDITSIALPIGEPVPEWIIDFIDYKSIINDNIKNFPLDSLGLHRFNKSTINYSNILKL